MQWLKNTSVTFKAYLMSFIRLERRIGWWEATALGGVAVGVIATLAIASGNGSPSAAPEQSPRAVELRSIAKLSNDTTALPVVGTVRSQSEAEVRTESSGQIVRLYRQLGDYVGAGSIIAEMENARERASLLQAEGVFDGAEAQLAKTEGSARNEQLANLQAALTSAGATAVNTLLSAYATNDEAIRRKADQMFSNADTPAPKFNVLVTDSQLTIDLENSRLVIRQYLTREAEAGRELSADTEADQEINGTEDETRAIKNFLDKLTAALNKAVPSQSVSEATIASYKTDANAARTSVTAILSSLAGSRQALEVARNNLAQGVTGGQAEDVAAARAQVKQAQGSLATARAAFEKTIVRAPISGSINSLSIDRGDFVSAFSPAATIANNDALEVVAYVTERDAREIVAGGAARIAGVAAGVITRIAPALDPLTKKIEVRIGITSPDVSLLNGEAVSVELMRTTVRGSVPLKIVIPLSALKVSVDANVVFTVDTESRLVPHAVILGELLGDRAVIEEGVTADMWIVLDARGLRAGEIVIVK